MSDTPQILTIDSEFKDLVRPLMKDAYKRLEADMKQNGCRKPIIVWNQLILDGFDQYQICMRWGLPFEVEQMQVEAREAAIVWICSKQLRRKDLTEETRRYLIGKLFKSQIVITRMENEEEWESATSMSDTKALPYETFSVSAPPRKKPPVIVPVSERIGNTYHIAPKTVEKYGTYSVAMDVIAKRDPSIFNRILSGRYKLSYKNASSLAKMSDAELRAFGRKLKASQESMVYVPQEPTQKEIPIGPKQPSSGAMFLQTAVKEMPTFDPNAEITSLTYTASAWIAFIIRVREKTDMASTSEEARAKLRSSLESLISTAQDMLHTMEV